MNLPIVCPSRKRHDTVLTKNVIDGLKLIVTHDEVGIYKEHNPDHEVIGTPKGLKGIAATRQWILDQFAEVFMVDDDITELRRVYTEPGEESSIRDNKLIREIIQSDAYIAKQLGAKMFGFDSIRNPNEYRSFQPFRYTGYLNNSYVGFLKDHGMQYALDFGEAEDYYISCLNMYRNRYTFMDTRFSFMTKDNFLAKGGVNDIRSVEMMKENTLRLRRLFGECVILKTPTINKRRIHEGERRLKFSF